VDRNSDGTTIVPFVKNAGKFDLNYRPFIAAEYGFANCKPKYKF